MRSTPEIKETWSIFRFTDFEIEAVPQEYDILLKIVTSNRDKSISLTEFNCKKMHCSSINYLLHRRIWCSLWAPPFTESYETSHIRSLKMIVKLQEFIWSDTWKTRNERFSPWKERDKNKGKTILASLKSSIWREA